MGFVFGKQPDTSFINDFAEKGLITGDPEFNFQNRADYTQKLSITAQLIPIRDLTIDVNVDKSFGKMYSELFKDTLGFSGNFARLSPYTSGSFSVSYISFQTLFGKTNPNEVSEIFKTFEEYRKTLSLRLAKLNPYSQSGGVPIPTGDGYYQGYGKYSQDVLLPAFLAAYTKKDPNTVPLIKQSNPNIKSNPFGGILPRPNWRVTYNGLTRIKGMEKVFTNFSVSHGYNSTLSMNSYNSALLFQDPFRIELSWIY